MRTISLLYASSKSRTSHASKKSRADILIHMAKLPAVPVRICRTQSTIPAGGNPCKNGNIPGSGKASGPTTIDLHEIFR